MGEVYHRIDGDVFDSAVLASYLSDPVRKHPAKRHAKGWDMWADAEARPLMNESYITPVRRCSRFFTDGEITKGL